MAENSVGRINLDLGLNYKTFNKELSGVAKTTESMVASAFKKTSLLFGTLFSAKKLFDFGKGAIEIGSNLTEVQNVVDVTFKEMSEDVNQFAKSALTNFGLSELSAKKFTSTMGAMLKSAKITGKPLVEMSKSITALSADMASFYNLDNETAFNKLRAGISGETEPLKQLGINMSVANMEAFALAQGIKKSYQEMSQAEQMILRYNYLLDVTKDAQGDFSRNINTWANQTKVLAEQWNAFKGTMGQGFINILLPVVRWLNVVIQKIQIAAQYFKAFTEMLFGVAQETESTATSVASVADATDDVGKSVKKAGKAVKGSLAPFDQLNIITEKTAESLDDITDGMVDTGGIAAMDLGSLSSPSFDVDPAIIEPFKQKLESLRDVAVEVGAFFKESFGPPIRAAFEMLTPTILGWKQALVESFSDFSSLGEPIKNWFVNDLTPTLQEYILYIANIFNGLLDTALLVFNGIKDAAFPVLSWFATNGLPLITSFTRGSMKVFGSLFDNTKIIFDKIVKDVVNPSLKTLSNITVDSLGIVETFWYDWGTRIVDKVTVFFDTVRDLVIEWWEAFLKPIVDNSLKQLSWLWDNHLKGLINQIFTFVGQLASAALDIYNQFIAPITKWLIGQLGPIFANVINSAIDVISTLLGTVADVCSGILKALGGVVEFIAGVFTGDWKKAWEGVKDIFKGIFDSVVGIFKGAINLIIDGLNSMIRGLNKFKIDVPDWVPAIGGKKFGFNIPSIPKLAQGGLATAPTLAMVGDNRNAKVDPEVIAPLSKLQELLSNNQSLTEVVSLLRMILSAIQNSDTELSISMGEEQLGRAVIKSLKNYQRQTGLALLDLI